MNIVKNLFEDIVQYFKNKFTSSRYVLRGKCKKCGKCCETILFFDGGGYIKDEDGFLELQRSNNRYKHFTINGKVNDKSNPFLDGALMFKCKSLRKDGKCGKYFLRSLYCRMYPVIKPDFIYNGGETLDGCGYYFDVDKKFRDYLNKDPIKDFQEP